MSYNLTQTQKDLLKWLVEQVKTDLLDEEFPIFHSAAGPRLLDYKGNKKIPNITDTILNALVNEDLLAVDQNTYSLTGKGYKAVENNFDTPNTSFLRYITPLADITTLDSQIKNRCLPILAIDGSDPELWDAALRQASLILEQRLRDVGQISDPNRVCRDLVNDIFTAKGTLASKFTVPGERDGYRDIYAGMIGAFRNPYSHKIIDPTPERAGPVLMFINVLLELLEELR